MQVLTARPGIDFCFFTRNGGVSSGGYTSLNLSRSSGDSLDNVQKNRDIIQRTMAGQRLCTVSQVHSPLCVDALSLGDQPIEADALVTDEVGLILGALGADCTPVLFYDAHKPIIASAHAGWKGAHAGVLENTVAAMRDKGADTIIAMIGPCIGPSSYEVGGEFHAQFDVQDHRFFTASTNQGHYQFDLPGFCRHRLERDGVQVVMDHWRDTYSHPDAYFSHRRMTHDKRTQEGRQINCIVLRPS